MRNLTKLLKALSDESRLRVLNLLTERECCVCEVMQALEISQSKASRILTALYDAGLLRLRREGRWALYSIDDSPQNGYVSDIVSGVRKALASDPAVRQDLERLRKATRMGPVCVASSCGAKSADVDASASGASV